MSAEIVQFIPRARKTPPDTDFHTIVFHPPIANVQEAAIAEDNAPSEYSAPESDPA